jgi:TRAP-type C4-dicarboxylate transport system substrate-binding protein
MLRIFVIVLILTCSQFAPAHATEFTAGGLSPAGTAADKYWQTYAANIVEASNGEIRPKLLTRGEIGSEDQILTSLRRDRIQIAINGFLALTSVIPELDVLGAPYLFSSTEEMTFISEGHLTPVLQQLFGAKGLVLLRVLPMGWMHVYSKAPALVPADLKGRKVRVPPDIASRYYLESLGYDLIPIASTEVVQSLQTGLVEAGTTVTLNYLWSGTNTEAPYLTLTAHSFLYTALFANNSWWEKLPQAHRDILMAAAPSGREFFDSMTVTEAEVLSRAAENKFTSHRPTTSERALWATTAQGVQARLASHIGGESKAILDAARAGSAEFQAARKPPN